MDKTWEYYNCNTDLILDEVVEGQKWMDWCNYYPGDQYEGWVHCEGSEGQFIQEYDMELLKKCYELPLSKFMSYEHSVIVCVACVKSVFEKETGIEMKYEEECGCESIKY